MKKHILLAAMAFTVAPPIASADEAPWGCQVLLCAASSAPSWSGISYCVPPMTKLISAMAKPRFKWPTCPSAGTGAPGYQQHDNCPAGYNEFTDNDVDRPHQRTELCKKPDICTGRGSESCVAGEMIPRPVKADPYFFDIKDEDGKTNRFWFNLNH